MRTLRERPVAARGGGEEEGLGAGAVECGGSSFRLVWEGGWRACVYG